MQNFVKGLCLEFLHIGKLEDMATILSMANKLASSTVRDNGVRDVLNMPGIRSS